MPVDCIRIAWAYVVDFCGQRRIELSMLSLSIIQRDIHHGTQASFRL